MSMQLQGKCLPGLGSQLVKLVEPKKSRKRIKWEKHVYRSRRPGSLGPLQSPLWFIVSPQRIAPASLPAPSGRNSADGALGTDRHQTSYSTEERIEQLLSTLGPQRKHLLICKWIKARWGFWKYCNFTPTHKLSLTVNVTSKGQQQAISNPVLGESKVIDGFSTAWG